MTRLQAFERALPQLTRLSDEEFERLADRTRLKPKGRAMARAVLVEGSAGVDVAAIHGTTRQLVQAAVNSIRQRHAAEGAHGGLVSLRNIDLPENLALHLGNLAAALRHCPDIKARETAISRLEWAVVQALEDLR